VEGNINTLLKRDLKQVERPATAFIMFCFTSHFWKLGPVP